MPTTPIKDRSFSRLLLGFVITVLLCSLPAFAQDPVVNSADPSSAEQETVDLVIMVGGENFGSDSVVDFLVSCDPILDPECVPGDSGVVVKKVKRQGPKNLKVTVDVSAGAQTRYKLDIQVRSRGRTGKGIELFRVLEKTTGGDDTPPGAIADLRVVGSSYWSVTLEWTMPADDGHDPASGPVKTCYVHCGLPGQSLENCPCVGISYVWGNPGTTQVCKVFDDNPHDLLQDTEYSFEVACKDETMWGVGEYVEVLGTTGRFSDVQAPDWITQEVPAALDVSFGHAFDPSDNPLIVGMFGETTRIVRGMWNGSAWDWSSEDVAVYSDSFAMDPSWGQPAFAGVQVAGRREVDVVYTSWNGSAWVSDLVTTIQGQVDVSPAALAFDPSSGQPVVGYCEWNDKKGGSGGLVLEWRDTDGSWTREEIDSRRCQTWRAGPSIAFDPSGNPAVAFGLLVDDADLYADVLQVAVGSAGAGAWQMETPAAVTKVGWTAHLLYTSVLGDFILGWQDGTDYNQGPPVVQGENRLCERRGSDTWICEPKDGDQGAGSINDRAPWIAVNGVGQILLATGGARFSEPGVTLIRRDPAGNWSVEYVDYYQQYTWQGEFPVRDFLHLKLTPSALQESPLLTDSPTLSWTWNMGPYYQWTEHHLYFAWKTTP